MLLTPASDISPARDAQVGTTAIVSGMLDKLSNAMQMWQTNCEGERVLFSCYYVHYGISRTYADMTSVRALEKGRDYSLKCWVLVMETASPIYKTTACVCQSSALVLFWFHLLKNIFLCSWYGFFRHLCKYMNIFTTFHIQALRES